MHRIFNTIIWITFTLASYVEVRAQTMDSLYHAVEVDLSTTSIQEIARLGIEADHGIYAPGRFWINYLSDYEIGLLQSNKISFRRIDRSGMKVFDRSGDNCFNTNPNKSDPRNFRLGKMAGYYTLEEMNAILDSMHLLFPQLISTRKDISTFRTFEDRPIQWLRISNHPEKDQEKPRVLYTALHHAREPMSLTQLIYFMWYLLEEYANNEEIRELIDNTELYFIPCVNPDGYAFNASNKPEGGGMWRKNRWLHPSGFIGVDLNRNYGLAWGIDDVGSSPDPFSSVYRGPGPFSEPETQAVAYLTDQYKFDLVLNSHTYGNYIIYPWNYTADPCPDDEGFKAIARVYAGRNSFAIGNSKETVGYLSNGGSDDWIYAHDPEHKIYSFTPEVGFNSEGFWPDASRIRQISGNSLEGNIVFAEMAHRYFDIAFLDPLFLIRNKDNEINFSISRAGSGQGPITLKFRILDNSAILDKNRLDYDMPVPGLRVDRIVITPGTTAMNGDPVKLEITREMGLLTVKDTVEFTVKSGISTIINKCDDISTIIPDGVDWGEDYKEFYSPPSSFADSPDGFYRENQNSGIVFEREFYIPTDKNTLLTYWLKWDIEGNFDYAQVYAITDFGEVPLCGKFTRPGTIFQKEGQPLYDGNSVIWVREEVDMSEFSGQYIHIGARLVSDDQENRQGINLDDLELISYSDISGKSVLVNPSEVAIYPNPTSDKFKILVPYKNLMADVVVRDNLGRTITSIRNCNLSEYEFHIEGYARGIYYISIYTDNRNLFTKKLNKL